MEEEHRTLLTSALVGGEQSHSFSSCLYAPTTGKEVLCFHWIGYCIGLRAIVAIKRKITMILLGIKCSSSRLFFHSID